jgi:uncharacterized membrane protein HdeD (DUF308 family)
MDTATLMERWWAIALRGVVAIVFGVLALVLPDLTLAALIIMFAAYALIEGVFNVVAAARGAHGDLPGWALLLEGLVSITAGVVAIALPQLTALALMYVIAGWAILTGVLEIVAAIRLRRWVVDEWRLALSGVLSVVFGVLIAIAPGAGELALVLWIGAYTVVFGVLPIAFAFRLRRARAEGKIPLARAA